MLTRYEHRIINKSELNLDDYTRWINCFVPIERNYDVERAALMQPGRIIRRRVTTTEIMTTARPQRINVRRNTLADPVATNNIREEEPSTSNINKNGKVFFTDLIES